MIAMPEDMLFTPYYDCGFYVYKDEFILHPYKGNNLYCFDIQTNKWRQKDPNSYRLYEYADDRFEIYAKSFGEWGSGTWFLDKTTDRYGTKAALRARPKISSYGDYDDLIGNSEIQDKSYGYAEYAVNFGPALVNKIGDTYYFTRANLIFKIENPLSLYECSVDQMYENFRQIVAKGCAVIRQGMR